LDGRKRVDITSDGSRLDNSGEAFFKLIYLVKFDDGKVSPINDEEITKLQGGGDWHSAYISVCTEARVCFKTHLSLNVVRQARRIFK
jgi:hypothetical protein